MSTHRLVLLLGLGEFISAADNWMISPLIPVISDSLRTTIPHTTLLLTAYLIPYGLMQPICGFISDMRGKRKVLRIIITSLAISTLACGLSRSFLSLFIFRILTGCFAAGIIAVSLAIIGDNTSKEYRQRRIGLFMGIIFLGQGLSVGIGGIVARFYNWHRIFFILSALAFISAYVVQYLPADNQEKTQRKYSLSGEITNAFSSTLGKTVYSLSFAAGFIMLGLYGFVGSYIQSRNNITSQGVGLIVMCFGLSCFINGLGISHIIQRLGKKRTFVLGWCSGLTSAMTFYYSSSVFAGIIGSCILGAGYIMIQTSLATSALGIASHAKGFPSALVGLGLFGGGGMGTIAGSAVLGCTDFRHVWLSYAILSALMIAISSRGKISLLFNNNT